MDKWKDEGYYCTLSEIKEEKIVREQMKFQ